MGVKNMAKDKAVKRAAREVRIAAPEETAELRFREGGAVSPYRDLLEDLQDAPKGSTLKIARAARYTAVKHIRDLGLKVLWGRNGDDLYIKIVGEVEKPLTVADAVRAAAPVPAARTIQAIAARVAANGPDSAVLRALEAGGPLTLGELQRGTRWTRSRLTTALLRLAKAGAVEQEDGVYRRRLGGA